MHGANDAGAEHATILDLFARTCTRSPDAVALEIPPADGRARVTLSYSELDRMSRAVATLLAPHAARDAVVALALPRTDARLYAAILGAMRAGCAYSAIDPVFPARQAADILRDANAVALIADHARATEILAGANRDAIQCPHIAPDAIDRAAAHAERFAQRVLGADSLAYVIYTSGTTGKPKGVEITHRSILNLVRGDLAEFGLHEGDRVAQGSSASYDSSIEEMWLAWAAGATALVMDDETARLGPDLLPWLQRERVTVWGDVSCVDAWKRGRCDWRSVVWRDPYRMQDGRADCRIIHRHPRLDVCRRLQRGSCVWRDRGSSERCVFRDVIERSCGWENGISSHAHVYCCDCAVERGLDHT